MTIALANGAKEIIPTENIATAVRVAKGSKNSLLCGERNGKTIEGFNLGNSPRNTLLRSLKINLLYSAQLTEPLQ